MQGHGGSILGSQQKKKRNHSPHSQLNLVAIIANGQKHGQNSRSKLQMANGAQLHLKGITTNIWPTTPVATTRITTTVCTFLAKALT